MFTKIGEGIVKYNRRFHILVWILVALTGAGGSLWFVTRASQNAARETSSNSAVYRMLSDDMETIIRIGVDADISEGQLRTTLATAANEHQDDPARDYLTSMYLWVEAYLVKDGRQSGTPAGRLKRYVPPGNPAERKKMTGNRERYDRFKVTLEESKRTLQ